MPDDPYTGYGEVSHARRRLLLARFDGPAPSGEADTVMRQLRTASFVDRVHGDWRLTGEGRLLAEALRCGSENERGGKPLR
jgi:hypothetical protein